jgi:outer membrane protein OmpA-like peptidoglycan-associated protein
MARQPEVLVKQDNTLNTVRYVFFKQGRSTVSADQLPNVEQIATYLKNHPAATVVIKGYASPEGNADVNAKIAAARAESVKTSLVKKYKIAASRISAEGQGVGEMFSEPDWNRVSICTINENEKK